MNGRAHRTLYSTKQFLVRVNNGPDLHWIQQ